MKQWWFGQGCGCDLVVEGRQDEITALYHLPGNFCCSRLTGPYQISIQKREKIE
jgi:hypothetical protein